MFGVVGGVGSLRASVIELEAHPLASIKDTVYEPAAKFEIVYGSVIPDAEPLAVPVQERSPLPEPVTTMEPVAVPQLVGSEELDEIVMAGITFIVMSTADEAQPIASV